MSSTTTEIAPDLDAIPSIPVELTPGWGDWVYARDAHTAVIGWGLAVEMGLARPAALSAPAAPAPVEAVEGVGS